MCAGTVSRTTLLQNVILQAQSPLNLDSFQCYLACHLDKQWSESLLRGILKGVDIGFQGERKTIWSENWKSVVDNGSVVSNYLAAKVSLRRKAGPIQPPAILNICQFTNGCSHQEMLRLFKILHHP